MPEEVKSQEVSDVECSMCGRDGGPVPTCQLCHGNQRFIQPRQFSVTEERQGMNPKKAEDRYGPYGDVGPKIVVLPGGANPGGQVTQD